MKKLVTLMLGMGLVFGTATVTFAGQDDTKKEKKEKKDKEKKEKEKKTS